jgi:Protein of unknown function (DUF1236)
MKPFFASIALVFALCLAGAAYAQVALSAEQERDLYTALLQVRVPKPPPASFNASVGMDIPADVELYDMPAAIRIDSVRRYRFTVMLDEVVLVDPGSRKVVLVLRLPHE